MSGSRALVERDYTPRVYEPVDTSTVLEVLVRAVPRLADRFEAVVGTKADRCLGQQIDRRTRPADALVMGFWWCDTPEKFEFWNLLWRRLDERSVTGRGVDA